MSALFTDNHNGQPKSAGELSPVQPASYSGIGMNDLVCYAVFRIASVGGEITAEHIVAACFRLFPEKFHLRGYPEWPDSTVVNKRWLDCRSKGYLTGSTARGFRLSPAGLAVAKRTSEVLSADIAPAASEKTSRYEAESRTRAGRFVAALENSKAYGVYLDAGNVSSLGEFDLREMLLCPMESPAKTLFSNLQQLRSHAEVYGRTDLIGFLDACGARLDQLLAAPGDKQSKIQKGMIRRRRK
jgi:hypothetical protein